MPHETGEKESGRGGSLPSHRENGCFRGYFHLHSSWAVVLRAEHTWRGILEPGEAPNRSHALVKLRVVQTGGHLRRN
jgi:hypothetical protein